MLKLKQNLKQKKMEKVINKLFDGVDDEILKACLLVQYCGYNKEYLDDILEQEKEQQDIYKKFIEQVDEQENINVIENVKIENIEINEKLES